MPIKSQSRILSIISILFLFLFSLLSSKTFAAIEFQDWIIKESDQYAASLKNQNAQLTPQEISLSEKRAKEAVASNNWDMAVNEYAKQVGKNPDNRELWMSLALALRQKNLVNPNWDTLKLAKEAAIESYKLSKDNNQKAQSLLVYGSTLNIEDNYESPSYLEVLQEIQTLTDIGSLRKERPEFADLMKFQITNARVNNLDMPPSACFAFSEPLKDKDVNYKDYVEISPKVGDLEVTVKNREICLSPLQFGGSYDFTFKTGLPSALGEKTDKPIQTSLKIKDQDSRLSFSNRAYVLTRNDKALVPISGVNVDEVKLKVLRINDRDLNQILGSSYQGFLKNIWSYSFDELQNIQGEPIWEGELSFSKKKNTTETLQVPFSDIVKVAKPGVYLIFAEEKSVIYGNKASASQWLVISDMGLTTFSSSDEGILANVRSLNSAEPMNDVEVQLLAYNNSILGKAKTSKDGIVKFGSELTRGKGGNRPIALLAYGPKGDFNLLSLDQTGFDLSDRGVSGRKIPGPLDIYMYTEQGVYRPGDKVHLNALLRDDLGIAKGNLPITFKVFRPDSLEIASLVAKGNALGFYEVTVPISNAARTGQWTVYAYTDVKKDPIGTLNFSVEDFVPSRILVSLKTDAPFLTVKKPIQVSVEGRYLFGAKAGGLEGDATLSLRPNANPYPNLPGYVFGLVDDAFTPTKNTLEFKPLDQEGKESLTVSIDNAPDTSLALEALLRVTLLDKGGRPEMGVLKIPVFLKPFQIGIKSNIPGGSVSDSENEASFDVIAVNNQGKFNPVSNLKYQLFFEEPQYTWYKSENSSTWEYKTTLNDKFLSKGTLATNDKGATKLSVPVSDWGSYRLEIEDPQTGIASSIRFNKGWSGTQPEAGTPDTLVIKTNKENYEVGETVELKIDSPFEGEALITFANNKVIETKNIKLKKKENSLKFETKKSFGTGVYCLVSAFRPLGKNNDQNKSFLPKRAVGVAWIGTNPNSRTLDIKLTLPKEVLPNQTIEVPITVSKNSAGISFVNSSGNILLTVSAVDEGILKLTEFKTPDPVNYFFGKRSLGVELRDLYGNLINPIAGPIGVLRTGGDMGALSRNLQALSKRSFKIVSLYEGLVVLDKEGHGTVKLDLPDFNGSLRLMAVAFDETRVGSVGEQLLVREPVVIEETLPRFLAPNDESQLSLSLHNVSGKPGEYTIEVEAKNALSLKDKEKNNGNDININTFKVVLEKEGVKYLSIPIHAVKAGDGLITLRLTGQELDIRKTYELSVRYSRPAQTELLNEQLSPDQKVTLPKNLGENFVPGTESIVASWTIGVPWNTESIIKALASYSYGCSEQTTSKGFGFLYSGKKSGQSSDQNSDESSKHEEEREIGETGKVGVNQTLARLSELQSLDGSFSLWPNGPSDPWLTAYVVDFLIQVQNMGYSVPKFTLENALKWLESFTSRSSNDDSLAAQAYALYDLSKQNRIESGSVRYFYDTYFDKLPDSLSRAFVAAALAERNDAMRTLNAFKNLSLNTSSPLSSPYGSEIRNNAAIVLLAKETLAKISNTQESEELKNTLNTLIQELVPSLGNAVNADRYLSTQEDAWLLMAAYSLNPSFEEKSINISLNNKPVTPSVISAEAGIHKREISLSEIKEGVSLQNSGQTPVWQHIMVSGIPNTPPKAANDGLEINREYYSLDGKALNSNSLSSSQIKHGDQLVVVLTGKATSELPERLLIVDMLPAGFEIENARLQPEAVSARYPWLKDKNKEISNTLYSESRDDRYVAALNLSQTEREFTLVYVVRAVTPGTYIHPGFFVEDMYAPKFYAITEESKVQVSE